MTHLLRFLVWLDRKLKSLSVRLNGGLHPKHTIDPDTWYMEHIPEGGVVLDIGCGNGQRTMRIAQKAGRVIGFDNNRVRLEQARRERYRWRQWNVALPYGNAEHGLSFLDRTFDAVTLLDVLEHVNRRVHLLRDINRLLKPDGVLILSAPNGMTSWKGRLMRAGLFWYVDPDHKTEYEWSGLRLELALGGFEPIVVKPMLYDMPLVGAIDVLGVLWPWAYRRLTAWRRRMAVCHAAETEGWRVVCRKVRP